MSSRLVPASLLIIGLAVALSALLLSPSGCGGGTGDGDTLAPDDQLGTTTLTGTIVDSANTGAPVSNAYVFVPVTGAAPTSEAAARAVHYAHAYTDSQGAYRLERLPAGNLTVVVRPPAGSGFAEMSFTVAVGAGVSITIRITVVTQATAGQIASVTVTPSTPTVNAGATRQFTATVRDTGGEVLDLTPTWVCSGAGTISASGLFTAGDSEGTATVTATAGGRSGSTTVTVAGPAADPVLSVAPATLAFGTSLESLTLAVDNTGGGALTWSATSPDAWITSVAPASGTNAHTVTVEVSRTGLVAGDYSGTVEVTSNGGNATVGVTMSVEASQPGSAIVFESNRDGNYEIYAMATDGSGQTNLTDHAAGDEDPAWSPDGSKIAFASTRDGGTYWDIWVMNADGSGPVQLTSNNTSSYDDYQPTWSPDGSKIAFASNRGGDMDIYSMNADGSGVVRLLDTYGNEYSPAWSPTGAAIALIERWTAGDYDVCLMDPDGSNPRMLHDDDYDCSAPAWSPDGSMVAFATKRDGWGEICSMNADGSGVTNLTSNAGTTDYDPTWSPDGARIAWARDPGGNHDVYVMDADGGNVANLTNHAGTDRDPDWRAAP